MQYERFEKSAYAKIGGDANFSFKVLKALSWNSPHCQGIGFFFLEFVTLWVGWSTRRSFSGLTILA